MSNNSDLVAELKRAKLENARLKGLSVGGPRRCPIGFLCSPKYTRWKKASQKTLAELMVAGKLNEAQIKSLFGCVPLKTKKALNIAMTSSELNQSRLKSLLSVAVSVGMIK